MQEPRHESTTDATLSDFGRALETAYSIREAAVVTQHGALEARPLTTQAVDPAGALWFFISGSGDLARDIAGRPDMLLVYADPAGPRFVTIGGRASLVHDIERARAMWSSAVADAFESADDPDLRLLRVDALRIDSWEPQGTRLGRLLRMAAAAIGAQPGRRDEAPPAAPA